MIAGADGVGELLEKMATFAGGHFFRLQKLRTERMATKRGMCIVSVV
jgi:hypothetical protein